jgi:glycerol-3-phosphate dehydrogenase
VGCWLVTGKPKPPSFPLSRANSTSPQTGMVRHLVVSRVDRPVTLPPPGPSTSSLAALSYNLHASLAAEHSGETRWGYRKLDTLSVSADLSPSSRSRKSHKPKQDELSGWLNKEVLLDTSVLGTKESTAQAHPALLTRALVELAQQKSVKVVYGTATGLSRSAEGELIVKAILRDGGAEIALVATQVVVAAGPWTGQLIKQLGLRGGRAAEITGSRAHSVVLRTADSRPLPAQALFTSIKEAGRGGTHEPEIYVRQNLSLS